MSKGLDRSLCPSRFAACNMVFSLGMVPLPIYSSKKRCPWLWPLKILDLQHNTTSLLQLQTMVFTEKYPCHILPGLTDSWNCGGRFQYPFTYPSWLSRQNHMDDTAKYGIGLGQILCPLKHRSFCLSFLGAENCLHIFLLQVSTPPFISVQIRD